MDFEKHSHKHALELIRNNQSYFYAQEFLNDLATIGESEIEERQEDVLKRRKTKSCSYALADVLESKIKHSGWVKSRVFCSEKRYKLFFKNNISLNMFWGHTGSVVEKIMSHVLAHEPHDLDKTNKSDLGIILSITRKSKEIGGFDSGSVVYDDYLNHLEILKNKVKMPILVIGLDLSSSFSLSQNKS